MLYRAILLVAIAVVFAGCGGTATAPQSTAVPTSTAMTAKATDTTMRVKPTDTTMMAKPTGTSNAMPPTDTTSSNSPTRTTGAASTSAPSTGALAIGTTGETAGLKVTVTGVRRDEKGLLDASAGMEYVIINVAFENTTKEDQAVSSLLSMSVKDSTGQKYTIALGADNKTSPDGTVPVGGKLQGEAAYEIPKTATGLVFTYDPLIGGSPLDFKLDK